MRKKQQARELMDFRENTLSALPKLLKRIEQPSIRPDTLTIDLADISNRYRVLAICSLLLDADGVRFREFLQKGAQARLHFLKLGLPPRGQARDFQCESMNLALFDAVAGGDLATAAGITEHSPGRHTADLEYEDDFLFHRFFGLLVTQLRGGPPLSLEPLLERWEVVLDGGEDSHLDVCRALMRRDSTALDAALDRRIEDRDAVIEEWWKDLSIDPAVRLTDSLVYVDGLAFLRVAELLGMKTRSDYKFMPSLARLPTNPKLLPEASWREPPLS